MGSMAIFIGINLTVAICLFKSKYDLIHFQEPYYLILST